MQTSGVNPVSGSRAASSAIFPNRIGKKLHVIPRFQVWVIKTRELIQRCPQSEGPPSGGCKREGFEKHAQLHSGKGPAKSEEDTEYRRDSPMGHRTPAMGQMEIDTPMGHRAPVMGQMEKQEARRSRHTCKTT